MLRKTIILIFAITIIFLCAGASWAYTGQCDNFNCWDMSSASKYAQVAPFRLDEKSSASDLAKYHAVNEPFIFNLGTSPEDLARENAVISEPLIFSTDEKCSVADLVKYAADLARKNAINASLLVKLDIISADD